MELLPNETSLDLGASLNPTSDLALTPENDPLQNTTPNAQMTGGAIAPESEPMPLPVDAGNTGGTDETNPSSEDVDEIILGNDPGVTLVTDTTDSASGDLLTGLTIADGTGEEPTSDTNLLPVTEVSSPDLTPSILPDPILPDPDLTLPTISFPAEDQLWSQNSPGILGVSEAFDNFGTVIATGDFNNDGYEDLAVGSPDEDIELGGGGSIFGAGAVNVIYGSASGLISTNNQLWTQDSPGVAGGAENGDRFGASLTTGDFNDDGFEDLAIGVPGEDIGTTADAGAVNILYGGASGLSSTNDQLWYQDILFGSSSEAGDAFGSSLIAGDFNDDGFEDLAVGAPTEDWGTITDAGAVNVIYGSNLGNGTTHGLNATGNQIWTQDSGGILDIAEAFDQFGFSLTAGDFDKDGDDDLAIGVPFEDITSGTTAITNAGAVNVIKGSTSRLTSTGNQFWHQNSFGVIDVAENFDNFGFSLTAGDYNDDGFYDLGIGVPLEDIGTITDAGAVNVLYGTTTGPNHINDQFWHQNSFGIQGVADSFDNFGRSLTSGDFDGDGFYDLGVGVPFENVGSIANAGSVNILRGSSGRLSNKNDRLISQNTLDLSGEAAENFDNFGHSLTAGDYNGDGFDDLGVGVPFEDITNGGSTITNAGVVNVVYDA